jgi:hypothetical protein
MLQNWLEHFRGFNMALMCGTLAIHTTHHVGYNPLSYYLCTRYIVAHHYAYYYPLSLVHVEWNNPTALNCTLHEWTETFNWTLSSISQFVKPWVHLGLVSREKVHRSMESRMYPQFVVHTIVPWQPLAQIILFLEML